MATRADCIAIARTFPDVEQGSAFGGEDYRVRNKIFMAFSQEDRITIKLDDAVAHALVASNPETFIPHPGQAGPNGWTRVIFAQVDRETAQDLIEQSWFNVAPAKLRKAWLATHTEGD